VVLAGALIEAHVQKILGQKNKREYGSVVCYIYYFLIKIKLMENVESVRRNLWY
jgi:hypothetical protein